MRMYVCGITPYDATHLGHAATYVTFDLLHRLARFRGDTVRYVQNVTDVDDPLLERARDTGVNWRDLADSTMARFRSDMAALRVLPPTDMVGVVSAMDTIIAFIGRLEAAGATYRLEGDVYFDSGAHMDSGDADLVAVFATRGGDPERPGKRHLLDSLLWQAARPGEPEWDSPWGPGRPGWHVECSAIAVERLGGGFDVQGGGVDLAFPHHAMCATLLDAVGEARAQRTVHVGMVGLNGTPMSKSLGNLVLVDTLIDAGRDPMAVRLALLAHHHREDWEWTDDELAAGESRLSAWRAGVARGAAPASAEVQAAVQAALTDDLDAPAALAAIDEWCAAPGDTESTLEVTRLIDALLGVSLG